MLCTRCGDAPADERYTELKDGEALHHHLCPSCFHIIQEDLKAKIEKLLAGRPVEERQEAGQAVDAVLKAYREGRLKLEP